MRSALPGGAGSPLISVVTDHRLTTSDYEKRPLSGPLSVRPVAGELRPGRQRHRLPYALLASVTVEGVGVDTLGDTRRRVAHDLGDVRGVEPQVGHLGSEGVTRRAALPSARR
jgi:hypothetical protein